MKYLFILCFSTFQISASIELDDYINSEIIGQNLPTASLLIRDGSVDLYQFSAHKDKKNINDQSPYDLASLTKVFTTLAVKMVLNKRGLNKTLDFYLAKKYELTTYQKQILSQHTVLDLLYHESMFKDVYGQYFKNMMHKPLWEIVFNRVEEANISSKKFRYKDIHFIILGKIVEIESGLSLSEFFKTNLFERLGLANSYTFSLSPKVAREVYKKSQSLTKKNIQRLRQIQLSLPSISRELFAEMMPSYNKTEYERRRAVFVRNGLLDIYNYQFLIHDPVARIMGGLAGHAGVISSTRDLARIVDVFLDSRVVKKISEHQYGISHKEGVNPKLGIPHQDVFETFMLMRNSGRGQGLDISSRYSAASRGGIWKNGSVANSAFPELSFGLTGYTGTSFLVDTCSGLNYILLTNRTNHNLSKNPSLSKNRRELAKLIIKYYQNGYQDDCRYRKDEGSISQ